MSFKPLSIKSLSNKNDLKINVDENLTNNINTQESKQLNQNTSNMPLRNVDKDNTNTPLTNVDKNNTNDAKQKENLNDTQEQSSGIQIDSKALKEMSKPQEELDLSKISFVHNRAFPGWLVENKCSFIVSNYNKHNIFCLGVDDKSECSLYFTQTLRPMGLTVKNNTLFFSSLGNIMRYENQGKEVDKQFGTFDVNYYPESNFLGADVDTHDVCVTGNDPNNYQIYYIAAQFNCVAKPSHFKTFETYWIPPWITTNNGKPPGEDRCHLNGLCLRDGVPRYVTATCMRDYYGAWKEHMGEGVIFDIVKNELVCDKLFNPHSPKWYADKLWVLEAGTGYLGYVDLDTKKFIKVKFIPGFLRGMDFINNYVVVNVSKDRHDAAFSDLPLGKNIEEKGMKPFVGFQVIDINNYDVKHNFTFNNKDIELYDIAIAHNMSRPRIHSIGDPRLINLVHL